MTCRCAALLALAARCAALSSEGFAISEGAKLWYGWSKPRTAQPPLVVCHGGPQGPSDYLFPLEALDRPVLFWDQLGCGRSDRPEAGDQRYGCVGAVHDLRNVLKANDLDDYHLYGQSWGGLLAFLHCVAGGSPRSAAEQEPAAGYQLGVAAETRHVRPWNQRARCANYLSS